MRTRSVASAFNAFAKLFTAAQKSDPAGMEDMLDNLDQWSDGGAGQRTPPPASALRMGPAEEMSGAGASTMTRDYSNPTTQTGISEQYARFSRMLEDFKRAALAQQNVNDDTSYVGKANLLLRQVKTAVLKADLTDDSDKKAGGIAEARNFLDKARTLLEDAAGDPDEAEDEDEIEKATVRLKALAKKLETIEGGTAGHTAAKSALPTITASQFADVVLGRNVSTLATPPDMTGIAKGATESLSGRIQRAIEDNTLDENEGIQAETLLSHYGAAQSGRVPMNEFMGRLQSGAVSDRVRMLFNVRAIPGHLTLSS